MRDHGEVQDGRPMVYDVDTVGTVVTVGTVGTTGTKGIHNLTYES